MEVRYKFIVIFFQFPREAINIFVLWCSILSAEFMRASIHDAGDVDLVIISETKASISNLMNGKDEVSKIIVHNTLKIFVFLVFWFYLLLFS